MKTTWVRWLPVIKFGPVVLTEVSVSGHAYSRRSCEPFSHDVDKVIEISERKGNVIFENVPIL